MDTNNAMLTRVEAWLARNGFESSERLEKEKSKRNIRLETKMTQKEPKT